MKIITENKAYVQNNDLSQLMNYVTSKGISIPTSIIEKVFENIFICDDSNRYNFVEFTEENEISFFRDLFYSVNYLDFIDMTEDEIINERVKAANEKNEFAKNFNNLSTEERNKKIEDATIQCDLYDFKMYSIRDVLLYKQGKLKIKMPTEIEKLTSEVSNTKHENKIKKIFKRFNKN